MVNTPIIWGDNKMNNNKRRALLKAVSVAPVIYTLPNGSAIANTSSTCNSDPNNTVFVSQRVVSTQQTCRVNTRACTVSNTQKNNLLMTQQAEEYELVDDNGTVYTPTNDHYTVPSGEIYYFDGNNTMMVGSCWNSITVNGTYPERW
jgi:hypothetical protein